MVVKLVEAAASQLGLPLTSEDGGTDTEAILSESPVHSG